MNKKKNIIKINEKEKAIIILVTIICFLTILDANLTIMGISKFGLEVEGNPIVKNLILEGNIVFWVLLKIFLVIILSVFTFFYIKKIKKMKNLKHRNYCDILMLCVFIPVCLFFLLINIDWMFYLLKY